MFFVHRYMPSVGSCKEVRKRAENHVAASIPFWTTEDSKGTYRSIVVALNVLTPKTPVTLCAIKEASTKYDIKFQPMTSNLQDPRPE